VDRINRIVRTYFLEKETQHNRYEKERKKDKDKNFKKIFNKELQKQK
jgi:hypothetical protein